MPEHLIRLRGGWRRHDPTVPGGSAVSTHTLALPLTWPEAPASPGLVRLVRTFGRPALDPDREALTLRLARIGGLVSVRLNDREVLPPHAVDDAIEIPLRDPLPRRNVLVLEVNPAVPEASAGPWGEVALVITAH